jgi:transcriptional regulator with XRE-family HTH domain
MIKQMIDLCCCCGEPARATYVRQDPGARPQGAEHMTEDDQLAALAPASGLLAQRVSSARPSSPSDRVPQTTISAYERTGRSPDAAKLKRLRHALGVPVGALPGERDLAPFLAAPAKLEVSIVEISDLPADEQPGSSPWRRSVVVHAETTGETENGGPRCAGYWRTAGT